MEATLFVPYWRSKGIEFTVRTSGIEERVIDRTWNASQYPCFPSSLGIRPQTLKMRVIEPSGERQLLRVSLSPDKPPAEPPLSLIMGKPFEEEESPLLFRTFLTDTESVIYLPVFWKNGVLYDAIDREAFGTMPAGPDPADQSDRGVQSFHYDFIPALCPNCGNDLAGEKESCIVFCPTCMVGFSLLNGTLQETPFLMTKSDAKAASFLPFWRISIECQGLLAPIRTGRILPGGKMEELEMDGLSFWAPAFKVNPQLFLRLAHRATTAGCEIETQCSMPATSAIPPVTITAGEAVKSIKLVLALLSPRDHEFLSGLDELPIEVQRIDPVLVPFEQVGYELTNKQIQVAVHVNALKWGRNL